ncbi:tetrahydrofolate dehydrogenase [Fervidicella metallireducens AeB]|uniref:Bifunctional protein FolD n=1 Tax=Fervidicella metallireducens AeB TaxID=1403537 RepID=A0A017S0J3_9CLOT|nr:bifunctional 5,10-methylenetetrahydrofolate dehydrogenase/5,10-methenyltetrahydrofolate cyclohydrolase [Fervidicella metallireducens]EYE89700.1 tetrahydrofolate dehydrogenase [Fervidicella metallireducens AeB]
MRAEIIDGKMVAKNIRIKLAAAIKKLESERGIKPGLATIIVGSDAASLSYVKNKEKICLETGLNSFSYNLPEDTREGDLIQLIEELNKREDVHGILLQLPLPEHISADRVTSVISPLKDVDCLNPINLGKLFKGQQCLMPCTPKGIIKLLEEYKIEISGKKAAIVGRSSIVGKPAALMLLNKHATVTICHSRTAELKAELMDSDIIISAVGKPGLITDDMVKVGAVVIDAGTSVLNGKLVGDVDFEKVSQKASYITPVPGGVGAMTTTMLIENVLEAAGYHE